MHKKTKIHFIGIAGIGMSSLAEFLCKNYTITGSDLSNNEISTKLKKKGIKVYEHQLAENITNQNLVIYTSAIKKNNPELVEAKKRGIKCITRGKALGEFTRNDKNICITGTHGKSTTTNYLAQILLNCGKKPSVFLGAINTKLKTNFIYNRSSLNVIEADESDNSFNFLNSMYSVITNIDFDHMDFYKTKKNLYFAFENFIKKTTNKVIVNIDCPNIKKIITKNPNEKIVRFSNIDKNIEFYFEIINRKKSTEIILYKKKNILGLFKFQRISQYNCYNVVSSIVTAIEMGISTERIKKISKKLTQPGRRFEKIYERKNISIIDDYAHHHNAIKEVRKFIKDDEDTRTILVFQPHRFTRLRKNYKNFLNEISLWKEVIVSDIYSAFEKKQKFTSREFVDELKKINKTCNAYYINDYNKIVTKLKKEISKNNSNIRIITMGAGDIRKVATRLVNTIKNG